MEEGGLVWWITFSFTSHGWLVHVCRLPGEHVAPEYTMGRRQAGGGSVMVWAVFCWETFGPAIHVDVTLTCTTYLSIVADHEHPFMEMVFPDGCGLFQQDNAPCLKATVVQEWFEKHDKFEVLTWPPNSPDLNLIEDLWDVLDKQVWSTEAPPCNLEDLKNLLLTSWCQIPKQTSRGLEESMPWWVRAVLAATPFATKTALTHRDQHNIRQVVIMLCLIGAYILKLKNLC